MTYQLLSSDSKQTPVARKHRVLNSVLPVRLAPETQTLSSLVIPLIQPKFRIGAANDKYEQEADQVADQVMRMPDSQGAASSSTISGSLPGNSLQRLCAGCQEELDEGNTVQAKASSSQTAAITRSVASGIQSLKGSGQLLSQSSRSYFEPRFGQDFSRVRIHTDHRAADLAGGLNAKAFTQGNNVVFGAGQYAPETREGQRLMAHELTHVVQQSQTSHIIQRQAQSQNQANVVVNTVLGPMSRAEFDRRMRTDYGVTTVRTGTRAMQITSVGANIQANQWQQWDPGNSSILYRHIYDAFDSFAWSIGGVPNVNTITFYKTDYSNQSGVAVPNSSVGASYGAGEMEIYQQGSGSSARMGLPHARSTAAGNYPGAPILTMSGTGTSHGAPIGYPTQEQALKRVILHELGHGLVEAALNACGATPAPNRTLITDYQNAVGWYNGQLYDIGVQAVATAIRAGNAPPAGTATITQNNWNHYQWIEQPISAYMVTNPAEDFAEAIRAYVENPSLLQARSPARYNFIVAKVPTITKCLRQVLRPGDYPLPSTNSAYA